MKTMNAFILGLVFLFSIASPCGAAVEWEFVETLNLDGTPVDVAVSPDGGLIYVLYEGGKIGIFKSTGQLRDEIAVGKDVEQIRIGPRGERLFALNRRDKTVRIISLGFIQEINVAGAPFKGPADAPVVIAVFSDFQ